jgi:hypothetical protein
MNSIKFNININPNLGQEKLISKISKIVYLFTNLRYYNIRTTKGKDVINESNDKKAGRSKLYDRRTGKIC